MTKIGKLKKFLLLLFCFFAFVNIGQAQDQDIEVEASLSETNVFSGEQVTLELTIRGSSFGSLQQPGIPDFEGLRWIRGSTSRSTQYTLVNGQPSVSYTFGYAFVAESPGDFTVPSIEVNIEDETYRTDPISFKVLDPSTIDSGEAERAPDIYVRLEPSTTDPYVGEQVITNVVLYFKNGIEVSSYQPTPGWKAEGFWKEELQYPQRAQTTSTIINGVRYNKAGLLQYAIFPTKSGELTISPFEISVSVRQRSSRNSIFGMGQERMNISSQPVTIDVKSLPELDDAIFIGAVGQYDISRKISTGSALVGESIEIVTEIDGSGNVPLVNKPEFEYPAGLEEYTPQEQTDISRLNRNVSGTRIFTDILVARNEGSYMIPEARIAFFDPNRERYVIETLPEISFTAERDPNATISTESELRFNVEPVTGLAQWQSSKHTVLYQKVWVWILIFLPLLLTAAAFGYKKYNDRMNTDTAFARSRTATDTAQKTLEEAENETDIKKGYHLLEKALIQFITDKLNLPPAGLSHREIARNIEELGDSEFTKELKRLLDKCESIAYAPNISQQGLDADIQKTKTLIKEIGKLT
ncbi:BatD family protein [Gracilimonas sp.]|uniref:BatD family protein n=1 Tax=Gracilimonas sp. TaxID=1974203 RepID=UPI002872217D|nr:BatD family protein [Gracilimonas sp.]